MRSTSRQKAWLMQGQESPAYWTLRLQAETTTLRRFDDRHTTASSCAAFVCEKADQRLHRGIVGAADESRCLPLLG